jgi:hypothetical protein
MDIRDLDRRDAGRILSALRFKRTKLEKGIERFGDDFDPVLGQSLVEGLKSHTALIHKISEAISRENDSPRSEAGDSR